MRDRLAIRVRVRSERLRGLSVVREAIVWSVRSLRAAGAEVPFVWGALGPFGWFGGSARVTDRFVWVCGACEATVVVPSAVGRCWAGAGEWCCRVERTAGRSVGSVRRPVGGIFRSSSGRDRKEVGILGVDYSLLWNSCLLGKIMLRGPFGCCTLLCLPQKARIPK